jgi:hypothetical protein
MQVAGLAVDSVVISAAATAVEEETAAGGACRREGARHVPGRP